MNITHTTPNQTHTKNQTFLNLFAMVLSVKKLCRPLKFPSKSKPKSLSASLHDFRSKISDFITQILLKTDPGSELLSLTGFLKCFELINIANRAFANLVVEVDYPMTKWGKKSMDEYLSYTLSLLDMLNSINSSVSHLSQAKISNLHALTQIKNSPSSTAKNVKKIPTRNPDRKNFKLGGVINRVEEKSCPEKEYVVLQALMVSKKIGFLAMGFVLSGLCGDSEVYMVVSSCAGGFDDSLINGLDSGFCKGVREMQGIVEEVKEVNCGIDCVSVAISAAKYAEAVGELKLKLEVLENLIRGVETQANALFSEVLGTRNKLLDNIRLTG